MKRTWICFLASVLIFGLAGCAQAGTTSTAPIVEPSPTSCPEPVARKVNPSGAIFNVAEFIDFALGNVAGYSAGATMWTEDGGATWSYNELILPGCVQFCDAHGLDVVDKDLIWIGTDYSTVYYSTDAGKVWNRVADPGPAATTLPFISFIDAQRGWVGYPSEVFSTDDGGKVRALHTSDGGSTWEQTVLPVPMGSLRLSNDGSILTRVQSLDLTIVSLGSI
jgi:photosystem II stability/assembly factor-like uncharacterized protein